MKGFSRILFVAGPGASESAAFGRAVTFLKLVIIGTVGCTGIAGFLMG